MRIIENGKLTGRKITCFECGCIFVLEEDDQPDTVMVGAGCPDVPIFACPQCLHPCFVAPSPVLVGEEG